MTVRRPLFAALVATVATALTVGCVPPDQGDPPTSDPLPEAPRLRFPVAAPEGAIAIVSHTTASGHGTEHVVDADGTRPWDETEIEDRRLLARAFGWLSSDGVELRDGGNGRLERCNQFEGTACDDVPLVGSAAHRGFSPDGGRFAVIEGLAGTSVLRVYDTETLDVVVQTQVTHHPGHQPPVWSPDSASLMVLVPVEEANTGFAGSIATLPVAPGEEPTILEQGADDSFAAAPVGWSDDGQLTYLWVEHVGLDLDEYTIRSRPASGGGPVRVLGGTAFLSFAAALRDGSVIGAPPRDITAVGEVPHLFGPGSAPSPLARPQIATIGGGQAGSTTRLMGIVEPR